MSRVLQQGIAAAMALNVGVECGCYSGRGCSSNSNDNYADVCRSEGAKNFRRKKKHRKIAKVSRRGNRRG